MKKYITLAGISLLVLTFVFVAVKVNANPLQIPYASNCMTSSATTSVKYMSAGTATTTITCDSYNLAPSIVDGYPMLHAALGIQYVASTSAAQINIAVQYSMDGVDWFDNNLSQLATTTANMNLTTAENITINGNSTSSTTRKMISIETPTRYVRTVMTIPIGSTNGSVWAQIIPIKEVR